MKRTNNITRLLLLSFLSITLAFSACKKDDSPPTKTDLLTGKLWKMSAFTIDPAFPLFDGNGNIIGYSNDLLPQMDDCSKDDTYKFSTDNIAKFDEGALKCDSSDPQFTAGAWSLNTEETVLTITMDGSTQPSTILELTADVFKMKYTQSSGSTTYSYTITFTH